MEANGYHLMSDPTTTLPEGIEPSIPRLTVGCLNHWAMEANGYHLMSARRRMSDPTTYANNGARTHDLGIISTAHYQLCYTRDMTSYRT